MSEQRNNRWNWEVPGFEPRKPVARSDDHAPPSAPLSRRYSISTTSILPHSDLRKQALAPKLQKLKDKVKVCIFFQSTLFENFFFFFCLIIGAFLLV